MKKLASHLVEIEVPDDFPSARHPEAVFEYVGKHPEIGEKIIRAYRKAYEKWIQNNKNKANAPKTSKSNQAETRNKKVPATIGN
jgi:hypothetical protein